MKNFEVDKIRNVALVGHLGSGKTTLSAAMLAVSNQIPRMGSVEEGTTVSDYHPSEQERQMSVFTSLIHVPWNDHKINILDVPGYPDFVGEIAASMSVTDTVLYVINAREGVEVGTELAWRMGEIDKTPAMFVLNHLDKDKTDFETLIAQIQERFGRGATVVQLPGGPGSRSVIDVLIMKKITFPENGGPHILSDIDPEFQDRAEELHNELIENIAENDEALMDLYFEHGTLTEDQMRSGLREAMLQHQLFPIFLTSAKLNIGISRLLGFITNVCPSPAQASPVLSVDGNKIDPDPNGEPVALIYRTMAEQHVGDYSFFRVSSGTLESGLDLQNASTGATERLGQLFVINGKERDTVSKMVAGDLGALVKLKNSHTNNTLRKKNSDTVVKPIAFPEPRYTMAIEAVNDGEEDKLAQGLHQLAGEDPSLHLVHDQHLSQLVLGGQGAMHLAIAKYRLKNRFGVEVEYVRPRVAYRETVRSRARSKYRHKKQTGGAGQFADISMMVEPLTEELNLPDDMSFRGESILETPWKSRVHFVDSIVGGVIDMRRFSGAIQKGVMDALQKGPIAGYPVGDVRIVVFDGGMHSVDSNENAFKSAARMCFRDAFRDASPALLEPIYDVEVIAPDSYTGDILGDLNTRRARIQGIEAEGVFQKIVAQIPEAELYRYSTSLRSLTQGRGIHTATFSHYEPMPRHVQEKVIAEGTEEE